MNDPKGKRPVVDLNECMHGEYYTTSSNNNEKSEDNDQTIEDTCVDDLDYNQVMKMRFDSVEDAEWFYLVYARALGFGIRKSDRKCDNDGVTRYRKWLCNREGEREQRWADKEDRVREPKVLTRVNCQACFRIKYDPCDGKYTVGEFVRQHNHEMARTCTIPFLRSHRKVSDADYAQAHSLRRIGMRTSQIMKLFVVKSGGYEYLNFIKKDLDNRMNKERLKEILDGDAEGAIGYLACKKDIDNNNFFKFHIDKHGRLSRLLWADSQSRLDYRCFGDVLVFDATYKTNVYNQPLVVLCGVNNHFSTTIFACALLGDENADTYEWVLESFIECMDGKVPISVMTDGDASMKKAIKKIIPQSKHRLCSWHLERNCKTQVNCKEFLQGFKQCMFGNYSPDQFEEEWFKVVTSLGINYSGHQTMDDYTDNNSLEYNGFEERINANITSQQSTNEMDAFFDGGVDYAEW